MKLFSGLLAATILAGAVAAGCSETPSRMSRIEPAIHLTPKASMQVGEVNRITALTENISGGRPIQWSVSPNVAKITAENQANGQTALFSADQPGVYVIAARADVGNGQIVSSETTITVNGRPLVSERMNEPGNTNPPR